MKIAIVLLVFIGVAVASPVNTGRSNVVRKDDGHGNYEFGYDEEHHTGGTSRRESGGKGWQKGSYQLRDRDGRKRTVNYVADAHGFRASVDTNEPGTDGKQDPADVQVHANPMIVHYEQPRAVIIAKAEPVRTIRYVSAEPTRYLSLGSGLGLGLGSLNGGDSYGSSISEPSGYTLKLDSMPASLSSYSKY